MELKFNLDKAFVVRLIGLVILLILFFVIGSVSGRIDTIGWACPNSIDYSQFHLSEKDLNSITLRSNFTECQVFGMRDDFIVQQDLNNKLYGIHVCR